MQGGAKISFLREKNGEYGRLALRGLLKTEFRAATFSDLSLGDIFSLPPKRLPCVPPLEKTTKLSSCWLAFSNSDFYKIDGLSPRKSATLLEQFYLGQDSQLSNPFLACSLRFIE
jgi:hypothetical protein